MDDQLLITGCTFGAVTMAGYFVATVLLGTNNEGRQIRSRLHEQGRMSASASARHRAAGLLPLLQRVGQAAAAPFMPKSREKQSGLRQSLARAGIYSPSAVKLVTGSKVLLLGAGMAGGYVLGLAVDLTMLCVSFGGIVGYLVPTLWLGMRVRANQRALTQR